MHTAAESAVVSICVFTYNQERFIGAALDSVLMQQTRFPFEVLVGEDGSTDNTPAMLLDYQKKYPDKVKVIFQDQSKRIHINGRQTARYNLISTIAAAKGKYIALLDGDDYWTDPMKLQKQFDFLEINRKYSGCFCEALWLYESTGKIVENTVINKRDLDQRMIFEGGGWYATSTLFFRKNCLIFPDYTNKVFGGDRIIATTLTDNNNLLGYMSDSMSVYRIHEKSIYSSNTEFLKYFKIFHDYEIYKKAGYYRFYRHEINKKLSASLYVMGEYYLTKRDWKNYLESMLRVIGLISLKSRLFNLKMFFRNMVLPLFRLPTH